jgi:enoyl-CoA hydratase/carnithine racemase
MDYETITIMKQDNIAILTFNRPNLGNRMNLRMVNEMSHALRALADDDEVRALMVNGAGGDFCCGWDSVEEMLNKSALEIHKFVEAAGDSEKMFLDFPKPTVVAAHGQTVASGAVIAAMADVTIMADDAEIGFIAINAGLSCMVAMQYIRQIVGAKKAIELMITGRLIGGEEAEKIGLVTKVVPREKLFETAVEIAKELANKSPLAVAFTKRANAAVRDMHISEATKYLNEHFTLLAASEDGQEALRARVTGQIPRWKQR